MSLGVCLWHLGLPIRERRVAILRVSYDALLALLSPDGVRLIRQRGIPSDARLVGIYTQPEIPSLNLVVESSEFDTVPEGLIPPTLAVIYEWRSVSFEDDK
jgi:hypothetical protein